MVLVLVLILVLVLAFVWAIFWPLACMIRGVIHCMHAVANDFEEALHSITHCVVENRPQALVN